MASSNNSKIISDAHPHTIKKFELIETYIKSWAQKLMLNDSCSGIVFIDCMCNSGVYRDDDGKTVYGTPIRVAKALLDVARTYTDKQVHLFFNDYDEKKILLLYSGPAPGLLPLCLLPAAAGISGGKGAFD